MNRPQFSDAVWQCSCAHGLDGCAFYTEGGIVYDNKGRRLGIITQGEAGQLVIQADDAEALEALTKGRSLSV